MGHNQRPGAHVQTCPGNVAEKWTSQHWLSGRGGELGHGLLLGADTWWEIIFCWLPSVHIGSSRDNSGHISVQSSDSTSFTQWQWKIALMPCYLQHVSFHSCQVVCNEILCFLFYMGTFHMFHLQYIFLELGWYQPIFCNTQMRMGGWGETDAVFCGRQLNGAGCQIARKNHGTTKVDKVVPHT